MNNFKKNILSTLAFCITAMPFLAQATTIIDLQNGINYALEANIVICEDCAIKPVIADKINKGLMNDVQAIEDMLIACKEKLIEQNKTCISDKSLQSLERLVNGFTHAARGTSLAFCFGSYYVLNSCIGMLINDGLGNPLKYYTDLDISPEARAFVPKAFVFCVSGALSSAGMYKIFDTMREKIEQKQEQRRNRSLNIQVIDNLLAYLNYEKGRVVGAGQALS